MQNLKNAVCPYCGKSFNENDDIVVCPECGTPHHRECYKENGKCANEEKHGSFEWGEEKPAAKHFEQQGTLQCKNCGAMNPENGKYCLNCGTPLKESENANQREQANPFEEFQKERERAFESAMGGTEFDGVSVKEASAFVGGSAEYFLPRFSSFMRGRKTDVNFSAFIFSFFYLFYRKMYALGAAILGATVVLSIPGTLLDIATIQEEYIKAGFLSQMIWEVPHQDTLTVYAFIASVIIWAMRLMLMLFINRAYLNKMITSVKKVKAECEEQGITDETVIFPKLRKAGGTSMVVPIIIGGLILAASVVLTIWLMSSPYFILTM